MPLPKLLTCAVPGVIAGVVLAGCGRPDPQALQRLACQQAGANLDMQSVSQLDALRKALGLAPGVDPIGFCRSIGVQLEASPGSPQPAGQSEGGTEREP
jgi:hypothetical protein